MSSASPSSTELSFTGTYDSNYHGQQVNSYHNEEWAGLTSCEEVRRGRTQGILHKEQTATISRGTQEGSLGGDGT
jgi:hypothetical protein